MQFWIVFQVNCQEFEWANALVGRGKSNAQNLTEGASTCFGLVTDENDFVYVTGLCNDSVDFDPGLNTSFVVAGQSDVYIAKYDPSGNLVWRNVLISQSRNKIKKIKLDTDGNILIIGSIQQDVDFDPSSGTSILSVPLGVANLTIIAKYTSNGDFIWVKGIGGPFATWGSDLEVDANGGIYITGSFFYSLDVDPSSSVFTLMSNGLATFFARFSSFGELVWAQHIPNSSNLGEATDLDLSEDGDIFISGYFGNTLDFDPGPGTYLLSANTTSNRYFAKYTNNGDFIWANRLDVNDNFGLISSRSIQLAVDLQENVFIIGDFKNTVDFDASPATSELTALSGYSTYICKYNANGQFLWAKMIAGTFCVAYDVSLDCEEYLNISGVFAAADFNPSTDSYYLQSTAPSAFMNFFAQFDSDGNFLWVKRIGNNGYGSGIIESGIHVSNGNQYVFGAFKQSGDFNPDLEDEYWLTMGGIGWNSYFAKYSGKWADNFTDITICDHQTATLIPNYRSDHYLWQDGSSDSLLMTSEAGIYWVEQQTGSCSKRDSFHLVINECGISILSMPNVFSPNDDGKNDLFYPIEIYNVSHYSLNILNRWGNVVFESQKQTSGWDGKWNGQDCMEGTYFWVINYKNSTNEDVKLNGFLNLKR